MPGTYTLRTPGKRPHQRMATNQPFDRLTNSFPGTRNLWVRQCAAACALHLPCLALAIACALGAFAFGCSARPASPKAAVTAPRTYTNPVYSGSMPDPSVIRYQGFYYAFGTTGNARTPDGRIFTALRSRNLVQWETLGGALVPPSSNGRVQYWAPEVT